MNGLRKFFALSPADQTLILRCVAMLALVRVSLNILKLVKVREALDRWTKPQHEARIEAKEMNHIAWAVDCGSRLVPGATCLTQALTLQAMLRRMGCVTQLKFGVRRKDAGEFRAHAWVEYDGRIVIGDGEEMSEFTVLPSIG